MFAQSFTKYGLWDRNAEAFFRKCKGIIDRLHHIRFIIAHVDFHLVPTSSLTFKFKFSNDSNFSTNFVDFGKRRIVVQLMNKKSDDGKK